MPFSAVPGIAATHYSACRPRQRKHERSASGFDLMEERPPVRLLSGFFAVDDVIFRALARTTLAEPRMLKGR
jgi:hypothetical protein